MIRSGGRARSRLLVPDIALTKQSLGRASSIVRLPTLGPHRDASVP